MPPKRDLSHRAAFESQGETYVRLLAQQNDDVGRQAVAWLGEQQSLREEETLSIAHSALVNSRRANIIAIIAIVCAIAAAIIAAIIGVNWESNPYLHPNLNR